MSDVAGGGRTGRAGIAGALLAVRPSGPLLGLVALLGLFAVILGSQGQLDRFLGAENLLQMLHRSSIPATAALGVLLIVITGGIDLSVGSVMALSAMVTIQAYRLVYNGPEKGLPTLLVGWLGHRGLLWEGTGSAVLASLVALPAGVLVGGLCGLCNGLVVTRLRVSPFVATLGMLSVARGLTIWLANRTQVPFDRGGPPAWAEALARTRSPLTVVNPGVLVLAGLAALVFLALRFTVYGRYCYAIGSSEATARLCGIPVERCKVATYALAGLLTGWAGVLLFAQGYGADPQAATGMELEVIAAVVIGGASLSGGQGTVAGTLLGVLILGVLENGVTYCNVPPEVKYILIGTIVVANTALSGWQRRRSGE